MQPDQPGFIPRYNPDTDFLFKNQLIFNLRGAHLTLYNFYDDRAAVVPADEKMTLVALLRGCGQVTVPNETPFVLNPYEVLLSLPGGRLKLGFPATSYVDPVQCLTIELSVRRLAETFAGITEYYPDFVRNTPEDNHADKHYGRTSHEAVRRSLVKMVQFWGEMGFFYYLF